MKRAVLSYLFLILLCAAGMYLVFERGRHLPAPVASVVSPAIQPSAPATSGSSSFTSALRHNMEEPIGRLFLQVVIIIAITRFVGALFTRFGQPSVIGEIAAGILLGPSLLGWVWPEASNFIFPHESMGVLQLFSQIGVCLFMFVVGMELDPAHLRQRVFTAVVVSHASIMFPYVLGVGTALFLYTNHAPADVSFVPFALFMGIAMSITAFPVLARILEDRKMSRTALGATAITCAAVNDATAWCILAFVVAIARSTGLGPTAFNLALAVVLVALMLLVVRPRLPRWLGVEGSSERLPGRALIAGVLLFMLASALATQAIGLHALFGSFLAGVVMPRQPEFREYLVVRLENFSSLFLLPLFFAFSGLRTHIGLLGDASGLLLSLAIIGIAMLGKLGGTMLSARLTGMNWNDAFALGALLNTRGLVELVALNIGYDLGILSPEIFSVMVIMALATTALTGPLLSLAERLKRSNPATLAASQRS